MGVGFTQARLEVFVIIQVHVGSLRRSNRPYGSFEFASVHSVAPKGRRVCFCSRGFARTCLWAVDFNRSHVGSLGRA